MLRTRWLLLLAGLALPGCFAESATGPSPRYSAAKADEPICKDENPTGSNITHHRCRTVEQRESDEAAKRTWINRYPANPVVGDHTYPGVDVRHSHE